MPRTKTYPIEKAVGKGASKLLGDRKLATALYRRRASNGQTFGPCGLLLKQDNPYGAEYAKRPCVCGRALSFGRLSIYSDGNSAPRLVHLGCASRALTWSRLTIADSAVCFGPCYAVARPIAEPVDLTAVWQSYNHHLAQGAETPKTSAELTEQLDRVAIAVGETIAEVA